MKNFLIPTTLKEDTICAVKSAINQSGKSNCEIILMMVAEIPDTYSSSFLLREMNTSLSKYQEEILEECKNLIEQTNNCKVKIHFQYGISAPVLKNIISSFDVKLIILSHSYKQETKRILQNLVQLASNQKCAILHLGSQQYKEDYSKALYIENTSPSLHIRDVQDFINKNFSFKIVSQTISSERNINEYIPEISETISKNNIDLLVQTRKAEKIKFKKSKKVEINSILGLPLLSVYEELI